MPPSLPVKPRPATCVEDLAAMPDDAIDVALGAVIIAKDEYGGLDVARVMSDIDALAAPILADGIAAMTPEEQADALAVHVFGTLAFRGNEREYYDPKNSLLPDVLERRLGIPITLSIVYCEVAKRVGVPARGVGFPGHFLVRIERAAGDPLMVDPYYGGRVLDASALERMIGRALGPDHKLLPEHLAPASPRATLVRVLTNLKAIYMQRGDHARAHLALDRIVSLVPSATNALKERGLVAARLGATEAARADLARVLELDPAATDASALRAELARLGTKRRVLN
jgi:regulator of sirC expression with transglutaminase-like and TPR domain